MNEAEPTKATEATEAPETPEIPDVQPEPKKVPVLPKFTIGDSHEVAGIPCVVRKIDDTSIRLRAQDEVDANVLAEITGDAVIINGLVCKIRGAVNKDIVLDVQSMAT